MNKVLKLFATCLCFTAVYSAMWTSTEPWVAPPTYVDDGRPLLEFTCTAYLLQGDMLMFGFMKSNKKGHGFGIVIQQEYYRGFITTNTFLPIDQSNIGTSLFCVKKNDSSYINNEIDWRFTYSKYIPIALTRDTVPLETAKEELQMWPKTFVDDGKPYIEFTCSGSISNRQLLSWFQVKGSNVERLATSQYEVLDRWLEYSKVVLVKTLEASDKDSHVYCAIEHVLQGGKLEKINETERIPINFDRRIDPSKKPNVVVQPNTDTVVFDEQEELEFVCGGDAPTDGRGYTWHMQGPNLHSFAPPGQSFEKLTNLTRLFLRMEVFYHGSQLYCAQDYAIKPSYFYGELLLMSYGELARSRMITLLHRRQEIPGSTKITPSWSKGSKTQPWVTPVTHVDDGRPFAEFTCHSYMGALEYLSWFNGTEDPRLTYLQQLNYYNGYRTLYLLLPADQKSNGTNIFCGRKHSPNNTKFKVDKSEMIAINFKRDDLPLETPLGPQVRPEKYVDDGKSYIEFTCWAYLTNWQMLTWFQIKDSNVTERLAMAQQEATYGYVKVELLKGLRLSDNSTQIYCAKENMVLAKFETEAKSEPIEIKFDRHIEPLGTPHVTVEPNTDVMLFDDDAVLEFVCGGSAPVDGRGLTWYSEGQYLQQVLPVVQRFNKRTNQNRMRLRMTGPYHGDRLYCAQDFTLKTSPAFGELITTSYGELARSRMITLLHRNQDNPGDKPMISPKKLDDEGKSFIEFACYAFLKKGQMLSWYQSKGSRRLTDTLLREIQLQQPEYEGGQWMELTLNKTLEQSDKGSELYCAKQSVQTNGSLSDSLESQRVPLTFSRDIPALGLPFVIIEPNTDVIYFDIKTRLRFTCTGSIPVDGRTYVWLWIDCDSKLTVPEDQKYDASTNLNVLQLTLNQTYHQSQLYCAQAFLSDIQHTDGSLQSKIYGELDKSDIINLLLPEKAKPRITPENFEDKNNSFIQFTCRAFLQKGELLSWYQSKGSPSPETILLQIIQPQDPEFDSGQWMEHTLKKTLDPSDKGSEVYCTKQSVLPDGSFSDGLESSRIPLTFSRDIPPLDLPQINIEPSTDVHYAVGTTLRFTCSGSHPVDDRTYTWFRIDSDSNEIIPEGQNFDASTQRNVLELSLSKTFNRSQLYCAQGFLSYVRHANGSLITKFYGELSKSDAITLILHVKGDKPEITPENFEDKGDSFIQFTCHSFLETGQLLSWYQTNATDPSKDKLQKIIQLEDLGTEKGKLVTLILKKTLEPSDMDSEIYCVKQSVLPVRSSSDALESRRVPLKFQRDIPRLEIPFVIIEPNTDVIYFDIKTRLRFTCSGSIPIDGRTYVWLRIDSDSKLNVPEGQKYDASTNLNVLSLNLNQTYHQSQLYCAQAFLSDIQHTDGSLQSKIYGELAKSDIIDLMLPEKAKPQITPENFEDKNNSFIQFTCRAFLQKGELLSWYQSKGSPSPETILLQMIQLQDSEFESGQWMEHTLKKTLEPPDKNSEVYCTKQSVLPDGSFSDGLESSRIPLTFSRDIPPLDLPQINIKPSTDVHYAVGTTLRFTCSGSHPVDDRTYTWFRIDSDSNHIVLDGQKYDASTHRNILDLSLSETYNRSQLYCAQGFVSYIRNADGSLRTKFYGEFSKSDTITLIQLERDDKYGNPQVSPQEFTDELNSYMEFKCFAFLRLGELLSWYQSKVNDRSDDILLRMIQLQDHGTEEGQWMELTLNKTLEKSDKDSEIYCAKQSVLPDGSLSDGMESRRVPLTFQREIPASELPYVAVKPTPSVRYTPHPDNTTFLRFTCTGSSAVDGRAYTWFRIDTNSNVIVPEDQKYDASTNQNVLYLSPTESYNLSQLYCAQGFLFYIRLPNGSLHTKFYGELAKSDMVSLIMEEKAEINSGCTEQPMLPTPEPAATCPVDHFVTVLSVALPLALAVLAAVLAALAVAQPVQHHVTPVTPVTP